MATTSKPATLSRLDKVFTLLENGDSEITRKAAAKQIGDVQKKYPHELNNLLAKLLSYVTSPEWSTRIAAAAAIEAVVDQVPRWTPEPSIKKEDSRVSLPEEQKLSFSQFDVDKVLSSSKLLLGSSGAEYQLPQQFEGTTLKDRVKKQRQMLEKRLGLSVGGNTSLGVSSDDLFQDEDLIETSAIEQTRQEEDTKKQACEMVMSQLSGDMSSRERNRAKRKARLLMKQQSRERRKPQEDGSVQPSKKRKNEKNYVKNEARTLIPLENVPAHAPDPQEWSEWPFEWICDELMNTLFSTEWQSRHGACLALREILKKHGSSCGQMQGMNMQQLYDYHQSWLCDLSVRLLCVVTLDRFADFVSDQVTAPVRESCAQTLSIIASHLEERHVFDTINILLHLFGKSEWEIRQSSMLSLQYIVAVRQDLQPKILPFCFPAFISALKDSDGDVRSVSAKCLLPTTPLLADVENKDKTLLTILWDSLRDCDELTASTQSVMFLLSKLLTTLPADRVCTTEDPRVLLNRLWPFLHHASASVREATLSTFDAVINAETTKQPFPPWLSSVSTDALWNLFQCVLLEPKANIRLRALNVFVLVVRRCLPVYLLVCAQHLSAWFSLSCQPVGVPIVPTMLIGDGKSKAQSSHNPSSDQQKFIGGGLASAKASKGSLIYEEHVMETRETVTRMIGVLCCHALKDLSPVVTPEQLAFVDLIKYHLKIYMTSQSALQRLVASMVMQAWWHEVGHCKTVFPASVSSDIHGLLCDVQVSNLYFNEITVKYFQVQTDMKALLAGIGQCCGVNLPLQASYSFEDIIDFCVDHFPTLVSSSQTELCNQCALLLALARESLKVQSMLDCRVKSYASCALLTAALHSGSSDSVWRLPDKLNPTIRPLMECIKTDENITVRKTVSVTIAILLGLCANRTPSPNPKLIRNLCTALTSSTARCPTVTSVASEFNAEILKTCKLIADRVKLDGIITLLRQQAVISNEIMCKKKKQRSTDETSNVSADDIEKLCGEALHPPDFMYLAQTEKLIASAGAECCIQTTCSHHQLTLFDVLPDLWLRISAFKDIDAHGETDDELSTKVTDILQSVCTLEVVTPVVSNLELKSKILSLLPSLLSLLWNELSNVRYASARCLGSLTRHLPAEIMPVIVEEVTPKFDNTEDLVQRKGAIEAVASVIQKMGVSVVAYAVLLVVPLLGRMSDHDVQIRLLATHCFAQLIQYIPVESSIPDPPDMPARLMERKRSERRFLEQLFDTSSLEAHHVPVTINATLRSYQKDGVNWLAFLNRYKLHGILCDDMGLGKTLQTICIIASDHHYKERKLKTKGGTTQRLVSLVVCPPTLTGHWVEEVSRFCDHLKPLQYAGSPQERMRLQEQSNAHNLIVASYEVVRNDISFFEKIKWNYCVLDEGHAIRSGKSKISQCVKSLIASHRLILTGTPIQNSVLELWSLFDFLMPGFLGSEQEFNVRFTKPILASRDAKTSSKEQEEGLLAMQTLHRQVLPFMLRRMKEDVLKDLPPKIVQDYYCDLSALQLQLYEDFARSRAKKDAASSISKLDEDNDQRTIMKDSSHVFQALQYLQKVCNHPTFVLTPSHPHYTRFMSQLKSSSTSLQDIKHAAKLPALRQLLLDCGIGAPSDSTTSDVSVVGQHRALIFCQHRNMLDIIQNDLFASLMPTVSYMRLDGGIPAGQRFSIVSRFNNDPSIDVLLLTTKVGGLGLNLTGADTVIFVEHDWNPMVDLQAMDRAHRIGQKKVVNVYRLITRGTLEEKILGLQKFKLNVANTVISEDNRALQSMGTGQVLDLLNVDKSIAGKKSANDASAPSKGLRAMIDNLGELWDQNQYDEEYNIDHFIRSLTDR